jgi:hypothetical protein
MSLVEIAMRRASDGGIDKIVALFAALAAGAAVFLMPGFILEQAVLASGLPDMLPQLSPPLGLKSRAGLALLSAGSAFGTALMMLRLLGFATKKRAPAPAVEEGAPRIRRRDRHPDAPARAPLSISRDLGEPAFAQAPAREPEPAPFDMAPPRVTRPATRRRAPLIEIVGDIHEEAATAPPAEEPRRIKRAAAADDFMEEPVAPPAFTEPMPKPAPAEPEAEEPIIAWAPEPEPEPKPEPEAQVEPEPHPDPEPVHAAARDEQPARLAATRVKAPPQESLAELLARFERALERKQDSQSRSEFSHGEDSAAAAPEDGMDLRLRSALENLRRFAPSRG